MKIILPGDPIPKLRPRFLRTGRTYDVQDATKLSVRRNMAAKYKEPPVSGPLSVSFEFCFEPPSAASKELKNLMLWNIEKHNRRPDFDNLEKFALDCGNCILWCDDSQIVECHSVKKWSNMSCTIIEFNEINNSHMSKKIEKVFKIFDPIEYESIANDIWQIGALGSKFENKEVLASRLVDFSNKWADKLKKIQNKEAENG